MFKKLLLSPWTALLTLTLVIGIRIADPTFVESVRLRYFDTLITSKAPTDNNIYSVNIDEASLDKYGQWPLPRVNYAEIIEDLYRRNAGIVVLNVLMAERDRTGGDRDLAAVLKHYPVILPSVPSDKTKNAPRVPGSAVLGPEWLDQIVQYPGLIANVPQLENSAAGVGIVNTLPEVDGVNRRLPLIVSVDGKLYPSIALETLRVAAGDSTFQVKLVEGGVEKMRIPKFGPVTTDNLGRVWIDWSQQNKQVSLTNLPKDFGGAIVIVGPTAAGIGNPVPTSKGAVWPHDVQAAVIATMANGVVIQRPDWADGAEILALVVAGIVLLFLTRWTYVGLLSGVGIVVISILGSRLLFSNYLFLFDATMVAGGIILVMLHAYGIKFVSEFLQKQQIKKQFGSYVNPTIVERLQKNPEFIKLGGERKELSIVMTDLRGFTTLGESFGDDVEGLTQIMNDYMTALSIPVLANDGTLIKFIGDASLHVHGAPLDDEHHARTAVKTALAMIKAIEDFNVELTASGRPPVGMGAGVNTGETLIGNIGAKSKFGYDVLGDSVSTAARLEGQTKSYGVLLIIGPKTAELVKDDFPVVWLDNIAVKGKTIGLDIYAIGKTVGYKHEEYKKEYLRGNWTKALKWAKELAVDPEVEIQHYYEKMIDRLVEGVPANWDGTYHATSK
jgi:adenylate cyclase